MRVIANPSSMIQAMRSGQVQAALGDPTTLSAAKSAGLNVIAPPQAMPAQPLDRNGTVSKPLGDVRVRQALNYAVDRKAIAKALYGDEALALCQYALTGQAGYDEALNDEYPHDVAKAKQLLAEAGYPNGFTLESSTRPVSGSGQADAGDRRAAQGRGVTLQITTQAERRTTTSSRCCRQVPGRGHGLRPGEHGSLYAGYVNPAGPFNPFDATDPGARRAVRAVLRSRRGGQGAALEKQINARLVDQGWSVPVVGAPLSYYDQGDHRPRTRPPPTPACPADRDPRRPADLATGGDDLC